MVEANNLLKATQFAKQWILELRPSRWVDKLKSSAFEYFLSLRRGSGGDIHKFLCEVGDRGLGSGRGCFLTPFLLASDAVHWLHVDVDHSDPPWEDLCRSRLFESLLSYSEKDVDLPQSQLRV